MKKQAGITLVEIAIVLVIIGLLLGGVLKGQEIITNAKIKNLENDFNGITAAIYSYQDRYRALPGDDKRADKRFGTTIIGSKLGNGNGKIEGAFNDKVTDGIDGGDSSAESRYFWLHVRSASLIKGEALASDGKIYLPSNAFGGIIGVSSEGSNSSAIYKPASMSGIYVGFSQIPVNVAVIIESRSDDNIPNKGSIQTDSTAGTDYTVMTEQINMYFTL
ncbi:MAG: prepilin-type cleavage/methylation domain-containing protein [Thioploca sp.]|nr:prepilin-type cleavage/methylation domain-containing protein [Thioploca sp.]